MGSDADWQNENGYSREVRGDFSSPQYDGLDFWGDSADFETYIYPFSSFAAASWLAKAFPGTTVTRDGDQFIVDINHSARFKEATRKHPDNGMIASPDDFSAFKDELRQALRAARKITGEV